MKTRTASPAILLLFLMTLALTISSGVRAQDGFGYRGWGPRGGLSIGPEQIFFGAHLDFGEFAPGWHFIPNADIGFGDDETIFSINPDVTYHFPVRDVGALYAGGLFAFEWWHKDLPRRADDTEGDIGLHALGGLMLDEIPMLFELNIGLIDAPDLKLTVGYTFTR